ncbi:hypothetical protein QQ020_09470 [Fulvivirgaceae bacterium BMA12]|uniref:Outer membrane protein beta-barrel domain-containing protein n=1 Tax=Agaribacillus aureus TaxID=3051825 RepID=A0ABT8L3J1_9BACT|nr:hypothetical protein [Fulvivirgaceae bacterium BMA12]
MRTILQYQITQKTKILKWSFIIFFLQLAKTELAHSQGLMSGHGKVFKYVNGASPRYRGLNTHYLEIGGGVSVWYLAQQEGMENESMPYQVFVEKGKVQSPVSLMASYNFNGTYQLDSFQLKTQYASLQAKYSFTKMIHSFPKNVNIYGTAGITGWMGDLARLGSGPLNDANAVESNKGIGYVLSTGISYYFRQLAVGAQLLYFSGKGKYTVGDIENQEVFTGSTQLNITISYQFLMGRGKVLCPIYKR